MQSTTAAASRAAEPIAARGSKKKVSAPTGESGTVRRPPRISARPVAPRAQRTAWALASVGTSATAASSRSASAGVRPQAPSRPPAAATSATRASTSSVVSSPSQPTPKTAPTAGVRMWTAAASRTASHSGLASPGSSPWPKTSPPTSTSATRSHSSAAAAASSPRATARGPSLGSTSTVGSPSTRAMCASAKRKPPGPLVSGPASATEPSSGSACSISASRRGPGIGSIGRRSQVTPPTRALSPAARAAPATPRAPTTSPPPPMPMQSTRRAAAKNGCGSGVGRRAVGVGDRRDLLGGAVELLVREHRGALERQVARDLQPGAAAAVVVADADRHGPRDAVRAQQEHVERMPALPGEPLLGVVGRPHVERRQRLDGAAVGDRPRAGDLGPGADAHALGLGDAAVDGQRVCGRLAVGPDALLEGTAQLRLVGLADEPAALVVEGRIQEEAVVLELEVLLRLADAALAERDELLALREGAHSDSPFLESDRHSGNLSEERCLETARHSRAANAHATLPVTARRVTTAGCHILCTSFSISQMSLQIRDLRR